MILKQGQIFTHSFDINDQVYNGFLEIFKDKNPLHTNDEFAQNKGFERKVMHGNILNGFISYFIGELLPTDDVLILSQTINFKKSVYLYDTVTLEAVVESQTESVRVNSFKFKFKNQHNITVAIGKIQIQELV